VISVDGVTVCIVIPCYSGSVPVEFCLALSKLVTELPRYGVTYSILVEVGNSLPETARDSLLTKFLETEEEYLFWLDDDIVFDTEDFLRVLALTVEKKSVAGLYCVKQDTPRFIIKPIQDEVTFTSEGLILSKGTGMGFSCQHRSLIEEIVVGKRTYQDQNGKPVLDVFDTKEIDGVLRGEDIGFFFELFDKGHVTYIYTDVNLRHVGRKAYKHNLVV